MVEHAARHRRAARRDRAVGGQVAFEAGYATLSAFDRMLRNVVGLTALDLGLLPEGVLAARLEAGLWWEEGVAESG